MSLNVLLYRLYRLIFNFGEKAMNKNQVQNTATNNTLNTQNVDTVEIDIETVDQWIRESMPFLVGTNGKIGLSQSKRTAMYIKYHADMDDSYKTGQADQSEKADTTKRTGRSKATDQNFGLIKALIHHVALNGLVEYATYEKNGRSTISFEMDRQLADTIGLKHSITLLYTKQDMSYGENFGQLFYRIGLMLTDCTPLMTEYGCKSIHAKANDKKFQTFRDTYFNGDADQARAELSRVNRWRLTFDVLSSSDHHEAIYRLLNPTKVNKPLPKSFGKIDAVDFPHHKVDVNNNATDLTDREKLLHLVTESVENTDDVDTSTHSQS